MSVKTPSSTSCSTYEPKGIDASEYNTKCQRVEFAPVTYTHTHTRTQNVVLCPATNSLHDNHQQGLTCSTKMDFSTVHEPIDRPLSSASAVVLLGY